MTGIARDNAAEEAPDPVALLHERAGRVRSEMGGAAAVARLHERGERTIREHIDGFLDTTTGSDGVDAQLLRGDRHVQLLHAARGPRHDSRRRQDRRRRHDRRPAGHGRWRRHHGEAGLDRRGGQSAHRPPGRPGGAQGHALRVLRADRWRPDPRHHGLGRLRRAAVDDRVLRPPPRDPPRHRHRRAQLRGLVVHLRHERLHRAGPRDLPGGDLARVVAMATGEQVEAEELGGADVHLNAPARSTWPSTPPTRRTRPSAASSPTSAQHLDRRPSGRLFEQRPASIEADPSIEALVPRKRTRAYDARRLVAKLVDEGSAFELRPGMGRGLYTCFARIDGWPVAVLASNPMFSAGVLDPAACEKGIRMLVLCDAFQIPAVFLQDVPGFLVGRQVEHGRILYRAIRFLEALFACTRPDADRRRAQGLRPGLAVDERPATAGGRAVRVAGCRDRLHGPRGRRQRALRRPHVERRTSGPGRTSCGRRPRPTTRRAS